MFKSDFYQIRKHILWLWGKNCSKYVEILLHFSCCSAFPNLVAQTIEFTTPPCCCCSAVGEYAKLFQNVRHFQVSHFDLSEFILATTKALNWSLKWKDIQFLQRISLEDAFCLFDISKQKQATKTQRRHIRTKNFLVATKSNWCG